MGSTMQRALILTACAIVLVAWYAAGTGGDPAAAGSRPQGSSSAAPAAHTLAFVPNVGQWPLPEGYVARSGPVGLFVERSGWRLAL